MGVVAGEEFAGSTDEFRAAEFVVGVGDVVDVLEGFLEEGAEIVEEVAEVKVAGESVGEDVEGGDDAVERVVLGEAFDDLLFSNLLEQYIQEGGPMTLWTYLQSLLSQQSIRILNTSLLHTQSRPLDLLQQPDHIQKRILILWISMSLRQDPPQKLCQLNTAVRRHGILEAGDNSFAFIGAGIVDGFALVAGFGLRLRTGGHGSVGRVLTADVFFGARDRGGCGLGFAGRSSRGLFSDVVEFFFPR